MGNAGWGLVGLVIMGLFVAWLGPIYGFLAMVGTCVFLGTVFRILNRRASRKRIAKSITRIVEDKDEFYRTHLRPCSDKEKVILVLFELYTFVRAVQAAWSGEKLRGRRQRFLDEVHAAAFGLLRNKNLVEDAKSFEALTQECYLRWGAALAKDKEGESPSGIYWLAKEVLLTIRPDEEPDITLIDGLAEVFTHNSVAWVEELKP